MQQKKDDDISLIRLNRFLSQAGLGSRRYCDTLIADSLISVNGNVINQLGTKIDPEHDEVMYRGKKIEPVKPHRSIAYHKMVGTICTKNDPQNRETIFDALTAVGCALDGLNYVGRLDRESEGLLLLSDDGDLIHALTHPKFHIKKVYHVCISKELSERHISQMINEGVPCDDQLLHAGAIRPLLQSNLSTKGFWYAIDLYEGKNRQIRRMLGALGYEVVRLIRVQFSVIKIGDLKPGQWRDLSTYEIKGLRAQGY